MKRFSLILFFVFAVLLAVFAQPGSAAAPPRMAIEGLMDVTYYSPTNLGTITRKQQINYSIIIDACNLVISNVPSGDPYSSYWEYRWDGTNSLTNQRFLDDVRFPASGKKKGDGKVLNKSVAEIHSVNTPSIVGGLSVPWLAFSPYCYFGARNSGDTIPCSSIFMNTLPQNAGRLTDRAFWEWADGGRYLTSLHFVRDDRTLKRFNLYRGPMTNAVYTTEGWTNFQGLSVPLSFSLRLFWSVPDQANSSPQLLAATYMGKVASIKPFDGLIGPSLPTRLPNSAWISDWRGLDGSEAVESVGPPSYFAIDGRVNSLEEAKAFQRSQEAKSNRTKQAITLSVVTVRGLVFGVIAASVFVFALLTWRGSTNNKHKQTEK